MMNYLQPEVWWDEIAAAALAPVANDLLGNALGDVDLASDAVHAHIRRIRGDLNAAHAT
jgi:hypothetical protein